MNNNTIILEMREITKRFLGVKALDSASLTLHKGEVHAIVGENGAGKSTLMNILQGIHKMDSGSNVYKGKLVSFNTPNEALSNGISMIHQEICLVPSFDVSENIWIGRESKFRRFGLIDIRKRNRYTNKLLDELGIKLKCSSAVETLSIAQMQLVEIARAVSYNADIIIMDEPTSALSGTEIDQLFKIVRDLTEKGITVVFISHKLEELFEICTRMTIMRDGKTITTRPITEYTIDEVITLIAGRELKAIFPKTSPVIKETVLECSGLNRTNVFQNISLHVRKGEILGICGLMGSGRSEIVRSIFGIDPLESGTIKIEGKRVRIKSAKDAIKFGLGMITEDRLRLGVIHGLSVKSNMSIVYLKKICRMLGFIKASQENKDCNSMVKHIGIKLANCEQTINLLSGGNQQKVIIGRWLLSMPKILILDEPTRGIDVGAKAEVHRLMDQLAHQGIAIILISSELPEVLGMSDRIIVIRNGEIAAEMTREEATPEKIMNRAFGV